MLWCQMQRWMRRTLRNQPPQLLQFPRTHVWTRNNSSQILQLFGLSPVSPIRRRIGKQSIHTRSKQQGKANSTTSTIRVFSVTPQQHIAFKLVLPRSRLFISLAEKWDFISQFQLSVFLYLITSSLDWFAWFSF